MESDSSDLSDLSDLSEKAPPKTSMLVGQKLRCN